MRFDTVQPEVDVQLVPFSETLEMPVAVLMVTLYLLAVALGVIVAVPAPGLKVVEAKAVLPIVPEVPDWDQLLKV